MNVYIVSSLAVLSVAVCGALAFPGRWNEIAIDDEKIVELAEWAVGEIGIGYSLLEIRGADYQVRVSYYVLVNIKNVPPPAGQRNAIQMAFRWRADVGPKLNAGWGL